MHAALEEAARGLGDTAPNPAVGAVIVRRGRIIARGYHKSLGGPHAEVEALRNVPPGLRGKLAGAVMAVTLEPCNHFGKTPPCTDAIIQSGIGHVCVGMLDPHGIVAGRGVRRLRRAGIRVDVLHDPDVIDFYRPYRTFHEKGRPFVTLKMAVSADGRISSPVTRWITGPTARRASQILRRRFDAILVGRRTAVVDNPRLTIRAAHRGNRQRPLTRVVMSASADLPGTLRIFRDRAAPTLIVTGPVGARRWARRPMRAEDRVCVLSVPIRNGKIPIDGMLRRLAHRGIVHLMVEGGTETANGFLDAGQVDEVMLFVSPRPVRAGTPVFAPSRKRSYRGRVSGVSWRLVDRVPLGQDTLVVFRPLREE